MRVALFLICLFYLLPGGYNYVYTGASHKSYPKALHIKKDHLSKYTKKDQQGPVVKETPPTPEDGFFIAADVEDDDTNNLSARKYKWLARSFYAHLHTASSMHLYSDYKALQPNHSLLANKYITQRALRI